MTLTQMEYVITLAKCLNFSEASRMLYITQPTLSKQISLIEKEIGFRIFHRGSRATSLTAAGSRFCQGIEQILQDYETLLEKARQIDRAEVGALRVGITEYRAVKGSALYAIRQMKEKGYDVEIVSRNLNDLQWLLFQGDIDVVIRPVQYNLASPPDYESLFLYQVENFLVVPKSYPLPKDRPARLSDFADSDILMVGDQMPAFEESVRESFAGIGVTPRLKRVERFSDLVTMVASQLGVAVLPGEHYLATLPHVRFLRMPEILPSHVHAIWKKDASNPGIAEFASLVRSCPPEER